MKAASIGRACASLLAAATIAGAALAPVGASAQDWRDHHDYRHDSQRDSHHDRNRRDYRKDRDYRSNRDSRWQGSYYRHRRNEQNQWRDIAFGAGALGVLGLLSHDNTLTFAGAAGALYSAYRMQQDINSTDKAHRLRAEYFSHPYFYRDGVRYDRETVYRNGNKYYRFRRHY